MSDQLKQADADSRDPALRVINELAAKRRPLAVFRESGVLYMVLADYRYAGYYIAQNIQYCLGVYWPGMPIEWVREDLA